LAGSLVLAQTPLTTSQDLLYDNAGAVARLPIATVTNGQCLGNNAGTWCSFACSGAGANTALSNLASVAINTTLLPGAAGVENLGRALLPFGDVFIGGSANKALDFNVSGLSAYRTVAVPDAATVLPQGISAISHNFLEHRRIHSSPTRLRRPLKRGIKLFSCSNTRPNWRLGSQRYEHLRRRFHLYDLRSDSGYFHQQRAGAAVTINNTNSTNNNASTALTVQTMGPRRERLR
jgi:hypothetical protein